MADIGATNDALRTPRRQRPRARPRDFRERRLHRRRRRAARLSRSSPRERSAEARCLGGRRTDRRRRRADDQHRLAVLAERAQASARISNACTSCNDFAAIAWALPQLERRAISHRSAAATSVPRTTLAALGPGSGLGVSALVPAADGWAVHDGRRRPCVDAGGHAARSKTSIALLRDRFGGHCSAERVLSGPGLVNLYVALAELAGRGRADGQRRKTSPISRRQGEPLARKTLGMFFAMLGTVAANLAVTTGARGGVYIAGGIVPRLVEQLRQVGVSRALRSQGPLSRLPGRDPDATSSRRRCRRFAACVTCSATADAPSLALGVFDPPALLGGLLVDGLLHTLRAVDRARQRIEHGRPRLGRLASAPRRSPSRRSRRA